MTLKLKVVETKHLKLFLTTIDQVHLLVNSVVKSQFTCCLLFSKRVSHSGGRGGHWGVTASYDFFDPHFFHPFFFSKNQWPTVLPSGKKERKITKTRNCHQYLCFTHKTALETDSRNSTKTWFSHFKFRTKSKVNGLN